MKNEPNKLGWSRCHGCGDDESSLLKVNNRWICDACLAWERESDDVDLEEWEQKRRERLAEAQEY